MNNGNLSKSKGFNESLVWENISIKLFLMGPTMLLQELSKFDDLNMYPKTNGRVCTLPYNVLLSLFTLFSYYKMSVQVKQNCFPQLVFWYVKCLLTRVSLALYHGLSWANDKVILGHNNII